MKRNTFLPVAFAITTFFMNFSLLCLADTSSAVPVSGISNPLNSEEERLANYEPDNKNSEYDSIVTLACIKSVLGREIEPKEISNSCMPQNYRFIPPIATSETDVLASILTSVGLSLDFDVVGVKIFDEGNPMKDKFGNHLFFVEDAILDSALKYFRRKNLNGKNDFYDMVQGVDKYQKVFQSGQKEYYDILSDKNYAEILKNKKTLFQNVNVVFSKYLEDSNNDFKLAWEKYWLKRMRIADIKQQQNKNINFTVFIKNNVNHKNLVVIKDKNIFYIVFGYYETNEHLLKIGVLDIKNLNPRSGTVFDRYEIATIEYSKKHNLLPTIEHSKKVPQIQNYLSATGKLDAVAFSFINPSKISEDAVFFVFNYPRINFSLIENELKK